jgi:hypothetical protein
MYSLQQNYIMDIYPLSVYHIPSICPPHSHSCRELAMQSHQVVVDMGAAPGACIYGGVSKQMQKAELRANGGVDVVVATPGRLEDLLEENSLSLAGDQLLSPLPRDDRWA